MWHGNVRGGANEEESPLFSFGIYPALGVSPAGLIRFSWVAAPANASLCNLQCTGKSLESPILPPLLLGGFPRFQVSLFYVGWMAHQ